MGCKLGKTGVMHLVMDMFGIFAKFSLFSGNQDSLLSGLLKEFEKPKRPMKQEVH